MIAAAEADYLDDDNIVFGIALDGDTRAYPKRILAWHEMFKDSIAGAHYTGVYCTLCGTMILYRSAFAGVHHELGTSGFLYRSNKLMYDHATMSLWSTFAGEPAVGPLVGRGIELEPRYGRDHDLGRMAQATSRDPSCCPSTRDTSGITGKEWPIGTTSPPTG